MLNMKYVIELNYGYIETTYGIYHTFRITDPEDKTKKNLCSEFMQDLDYDPETSDEFFNYDSMILELPDSIVEKIIEDYRRN